MRSFHQHAAITRPATNLPHNQTTTISTHNRTTTISTISGPRCRARDGPRALRAGPQLERGMEGPACQLGAHASWCMVHVETPNLQAHSKWCDLAMTHPQSPAFMLAGPVDGHPREPEPAVGAHGGAEPTVQQVHCRQSKGAGHTLCQARLYVVSQIALTSHVRVHRCPPLDSQALPNVP